MYDNFDCKGYYQLLEVFRRTLKLIILALLLSNPYAEKCRSKKYFIYLIFQKYNESMHLY